jgi:hypothetical protein
MSYKAFKRFKQITQYVFCPISGASQDMQGLIKIFISCNNMSIQLVNFARNKLCL